MIEQTQFEEGVNNLLCFLKGLELFRKGFGCITGIKTDQYELELHKNLAEFTLQFYEKQNQPSKQKQIHGQKKPSIGIRIRDKNRTNNKNLPKNEKFHNNEN